MLRFYAVLLLITLLPAHAGAGMLEVAPTVFNLSPDSPYAVLYITNHNPAPVNVQVEALDWKNTDKGDELTPSQSLVISPPMIQLAPGRKQIVRIAAKMSNTDLIERSFRLLVSELPNPAGARIKRQVEVLLQFSIPVFLAPAEEGPLQLEWSAAYGDDLRLTAHNHGRHHLKLSDLACILPDGREVKVAADTFRYLLPGASFSWKVDIPGTKTGETLKVQARDDTYGNIKTLVRITPP